MNWIELNWIELYWIELNWIELNRIELTDHFYLQSIVLFISEYKELWKSIYGDYILLYLILFSAFIISYTLYVNSLAINVFLFRFIMIHWENDLSFSKDQQVWIYSNRWLACLVLLFMRDILNMEWLISLMERIMIHWENNLSFSKDQQVWIYSNR